MKPKPIIIVDEAGKLFTTGATWDEICACAQLEPSDLFAPVVRSEKTYQQFWDDVDDVIIGRRSIEREIR